MNFLRKASLKYRIGTYFVPGTVLAADEILHYPKTYANTPEKVVGLFKTASSWIYTIFLIIAVIAIIYTAFMYLTAAGDAEKVKKAHKALTYSIVAIVVAILAGSIPILIQNLLGGSSGSTDLSPGGPNPPGVFVN